MIFSLKIKKLGLKLLITEAQSSTKLLSDLFLLLCYISHASECLYQNIWWRLIGLTACLKLHYFPLIVISKCRGHLRGLYFRNFSFVEHAPGPPLKASACCAHAWMRDRVAIIKVTLPKLMEFQRLSTLQRLRHALENHHGIHSS